MVGGRLHPTQICNLLSCIYGVKFSWNLFNTPISYLTEFRRRAEESKSKALTFMIKAEMEGKVVEVDSSGDPLDSSELEGS